MNFFIKHLNADAQDSAAASEEVVEATTATTNAPVEEQSPAVEAIAETVAPEATMI